MKQLILFRHGKAVRDHEAPDDRSRGLTERGERDVLRTATWLKDWGVTLDKALVSDAVRTRETWTIAAPVLDDAPAIFLSSLYLAGPERVLKEVDRLAELPCGMIVGHNPGLHELAMWLLDIGGADDHSAAQQLRNGMPTSGAALFVAAEDSPPQPGAFKLAAFVNPSRL